MPLTTTNNAIETANNPLIKFGGQSSSEALRRINDNLRTDLLALNNRADKLNLDIANASGVFTLQSQAIASKITALSGTLTSLITNLAATGNVALADMFSINYIADPTTVGLTKADVDTVYGQATLKITNSQDKLVSTDANGEVWIPENSEISFTYTASSTNAVPADITYQVDDDFVYAIDQRQDTAWVQQIPGADARCNVWVKIRVPTDVFTNAQANTLILHPFPSMTHDLVQVEYRDPTGWHTCDLSYMPGWNGTRVVAFGNTRVFFPKSDVYEIRLWMKVQSVSASYWGFSHIALKQLDFAATSELNVKFGSFEIAANYHSPTYTINGKSPAALATLTKTPNSSTNVAIGLVQSVAGSTPVITSIRSAWS